MHDTHMGSPPLRGLSRLLDGARPWGSLDVQPDRFGVTRYRLVVYPPGISQPERRRVRLARGWPVWGAFVWIACEVWLTKVTGPFTALGISTGILAAIAAITMTRAGKARTKVRTLAVAVSATFHNAEASATRERLEQLALALIDADEQLQAGEITAVDHELMWWRVYDEMAPHPVENP